jgi:hypothetical protein
MVPISQNYYGFKPKNILFGWTKKGFSKDVLGFQNFGYFTYEGLGKMLEGDFAVMWAKQFLLVSGNDWI